MKKRSQRGIALLAIAGVALAVHAQDTIDQSQYPTIVQQPVDACLPVGATATFSVQATNATAYQWLFNGNSLDGQTNSVLTVLNVNVANVGFYSVAAINGSEIVPSRSALLNVYTSSGSSSSSTSLSAPIRSLSLMSSGVTGAFDMSGGGTITVFGMPVTAGGGNGNCPGRYSGYVNFTKTMSQGWGWAPSTNTTVYTASDLNQSNTKVQYVGAYGDNGCAQTTVTVSNPMSPVYRFSIYFPVGSQVPTNAYPITLSGFNP